MKSSTGMTLTELVVVFAVIMVLTIASIPVFFYLQTVSREKEMNRTLSIIRTQLATWHYDQLLYSKSDSYPPVLDNNQENSVCVSCFDVVLKKGINSPYWFKVSSTEYYFSLKDNTPTLSDYKEEGNYKITYHPSMGQLDSESL